MFTIFEGLMEFVYLTRRADNVHRSVFDPVVELALHPDDLPLRRTSVIILALIVIHVRFFVRTFHLVFFSPSFSREENGNKNSIFLI